MKIFVISTVDAIERRAAAARQLEAVGLEFEFFDAVDRVAAAFRHFDGFNRRLFRLNTGRLPLPGEIGCYASHKALWKTCVRLGSPIVVLEDDFELTQDFAAVLADIESWIESFGFIRLQSWERSRAQDGVGPVRYLANVPLCLLAYAISPAAAESLIAGSSILSAPVDKFVQKTWEHSTPIFGLEEPIVTTSPLAEESMIGDRTDKCRDATLVVSRLVYKSVAAWRRMHFNRSQTKWFEIEGFRNGTRLWNRRTNFLHRSRST